MNLFKGKKNPTDLVKSCKKHLLALLDEKQNKDEKLMKKVGCHYHYRHGQSCVCAGRVPSLLVLELMSDVSRWCLFDCRCAGITESGKAEFKLCRNEIYVVR